LYSETRNLGM